MSIRVMASLWDLELNPTVKLVLLALADCANDEGLAWPSIATLARKASVGERTVQRSLVEARALGIISREEVIGRGCKYTFTPFTPRHAGTPATVSPVTNETETPATVAPHPRHAGTQTVIEPLEPSKRQKARAVDHELPDDWQPQPFGLNTESRKLVDGWPPGEAAIQLEQFRAHHGKKGDRFKDWQKAWSTWVLNSRNFRRQQNGKQPDSDGLGRTGRAMLAVQNELRQAGHY